MFIAVNGDDERVMACNAKKGITYYCPVCHGKVFLRDGNINIAHFAHENNICDDNWHYDMSDWHRTMQSYFPEENRECVITWENRKHRADVAIDNTIIEMQHSPISSEEFQDRNNFFRAAGYRVVWIFDVRDRFANKQIDYISDDDYKFKWLNPLRVFQELEHKITDYDSSFSLYLDIYGEDVEYSDEKMYCVNKVVWTAGNSDDYVDMSRFCISRLAVNLCDIKSTDIFFTSSRQNAKTNNELYIQRLKEQQIPCSTKYIGIIGGNRGNYMCPRNGQNGRLWTQNDFGLDLSGKGACRYCKYCSHMYVQIIGGKRRTEITCCFPRQIREIDANAHPGYECDCAPEIES